MVTRILVLFLCVTSVAARAQDTIFSASAVEAVEQSLASDAMRGRAVYTPDIERAADYIEAQFKASGLLTWNGSSSYRQPFALVRAQLDTLYGRFNGTPLTTQNTVIISSGEHIHLDEVNLNLSQIIAGQDLRSTVQKIISSKGNHLVFVDTSFSKTFSRLNRMAGQQFGSPYTNVFVLTAEDHVSHFEFALNAEQKIQESKLANVVGILPGRGPHKGEIVIFSGHYDHLGVRKPDARGDSIYNGANDDASGTTAVILLSRYFSKMHDNERTIVFAAFTAEEIGEWGSQYFSGQFEPGKVVAMFNIEMIGSPSKWGDNSAFITGFERSSMSTILQKNLTGSAFNFYPDPYPTQHLFYRSDNASLARKGVPAHTISTTQIDIDKTYHTPEDEVSTLDLKNMAEIIKAIALSSKTIIAGKDTPSRVDTTQLQ